MLFNFNRKLVQKSFTNILNNSSRAFASTLVIAEHDGTSLSPATLSTINAAKEIGNDISLLICNNNNTDVIDEAKRVNGISKILSGNHSIFENKLAESYSETVKYTIDNNDDFNYILIGSTNHGKNVIPRISAQFTSNFLGDVIEIINKGEQIKRPMYAGNAIATVELQKDKKQFLGIRATAFEKVELNDNGDVPVEDITIDDSLFNDRRMATFKQKNETTSDRPDLTQARVVVSGGRGLKNGENFSIIDKLAEKLGGAMGASRAAVDAGWVPSDLQVGQTGKVVAPELYIAAGISGAIQHVSGMKDSKVIVAINKDPEAPIFQIADYGLVADLFEAVPELTEKL